VFKIKMSEKVKDNVTGFEGTVTVRAEYLTGCRQYFVQPKMKKGAKDYPEGHWFDEDRLLDKKTPANRGGAQVDLPPTK
jgi:hypothetical protein